MNRTSPRPERSRRNARRLRRKRALRRRLVLAGILLAVIIIVIMLISNSGSSNVIALYLGDERFAYVDATGEVSEAELMAADVQRLEAVQNAEVRVSNVITFREVNRADQDAALQYNEVIERLVTALEFQVVGFSIVVDGSQVAILRNQDEVDEVIWMLQSAFVENRENYITIEFVEDFNTTRATIDTSELDSVSYAFYLLDRSVVETMDYTVQPGENLSIIAANHGISLAQAFADNPHIPSSGELSIGEILQIQQTRPHLSVRTVEEVTRIEYIEIVTLELPNPGAPVGFYEVLVEGERGEQEIVSRITRVNGTQQSIEDIATRQIVDMVYREIEVGAGG